MLAPQRQSMIIERVRRTGAVRVADLVEELGVSDMTIRRDLESLADRGLVSKVHGGATAVGISSTDEPGFAAKSMREKTAKEAIARAAAELVEPGEAIALSGGTTTWTLAQHLTGTAGLTVVTNSVPVADVFYRSGRSDQTVILTGGIRTPSDALVGPFAVATLETINVNTLFLGVHGISATGFTTPNIDESETDRALIRSARRLVVLADSTKWGTVGIRTIARCEQADVLICDTGLPESARTVFRDSVGRLILADAGGDR